MKPFFKHVATAVLASIGLTACTGPSTGVIGPQGDAYVVHQSEHLYQTDGTNGGTSLLYSLSAPNSNHHNDGLYGLVTLGDFVYFTQSITSPGTFFPQTSWSFHQLNTGSNAVVQQPYLANNQLNGKIRTLTVNNALYVYRTSIDSGTNIPMALELVAYDELGAAVDLSSLFTSYDMFFGEAVAIDTKIFFLSKLGFVIFDTISGVATEVSLPTTERSVYLGQEDDKLFIVGGEVSSNSPKLYSYDPSNSSNVPVEVSSTFFGTLDGENIPNSGGYIFGSDGGNLIAHNAASGVETTLLPCINIELLYEENSKAHIACAQTSSGYIDIASIDLTGGTPTAQIISSPQQGTFADRAKNYGVVDNKLYYNGRESSAQKVWVWDLVSNTTTPLIINTEYFSHAKGFTEYNGTLIFSGQKLPQPATNQLFKFDPVTTNLDVLQ